MSSSVTFFLAYSVRLHHSQCSLPLPSGTVGWHDMYKVIWQTKWGLEWMNTNCHSPFQSCQISKDQGQHRYNGWWFTALNVHRKRIMTNMDDHKRQRLINIGWEGKDTSIAENGVRTENIKTRVSPNWTSIISSDMSENSIRIQTNYVMPYKWK